MIFYGTKGSHLHSERKSSIKCDNCNEITNHNISVYGKYGYLYWIPVFPMSKKVFSECTNCNYTQDFNGMNEKLRNASADVKRNTKTPIWYWSGLGIIGVIFVFGIFSAVQHDKDVVDYIASPLKGDVIDYKPTEYYSTLKIANVTKDSIFLIPNDYEIERKSKLYKIDKSKNYTAEPYAVSKEEFKKLFKEKVFLDIDR